MILDIFYIKLIVGYLTHQLFLSRANYYNPLSKKEIDEHLTTTTKNDKQYVSVHEKVLYIQITRGNEMKKFN